MLDARRVLDHWWAFALRGLVALIFGVLALIWPGVTLAVLVLLWGAYALVDGVLSLVAAFRTEQDHRWALVLEGVLGIGAGFVAFFWPGLTALVLLYIIAFWTLLMGLLQVVAAFRLRKVIENECWMALSGIASLFFGMAVVLSPGAGALALIWLIGIYAIVFGVLLIVLSFNLRSIGQRRSSPSLA
jgi:uncharacterized membrane protein HdeD (DUF308 family)